MSCNETITGKIKPFPMLEGETKDTYIIRFADSIWRKIGFDETPDSHDFGKMFNGIALMIGDIIYTIINKTEHDEGHICYASKNEDGTIDFVLQFYNGGTYFEEMLEEALIAVT